jgi:hypothetical protein
MHFLSDKEFSNLEASLKMLPQEVEAVLCRTTDRKIIYSSMSDIKTGIYMEKDEIWNYALQTSDRYFYQFSRIPSAGEELLLITRLSLNRIKNEQKTKNYLKVLFAVIVITTISLTLISFISKAIFEGLHKIELSSALLAEGKLNKPIISDVSSNKNNEFICIMSMASIEDSQIYFLSL